MTGCTCGPGGACDVCGGETRLTPGEFRELMDLVMASDPWPLDGESSVFVQGLLADEARARGFGGYIEAYNGYAPADGDLRSG